jgi:2-methylcitrate dehydratase PrpD
MSLTRELVRLIRGKEITREDREKAALFVLDTLACAVGALGTEPARMLGAVAPPQSADTARRAFYLGGLSHILEMDDLHRDSVTHPGCVVIPAAWAIAEELDLGGCDFLDAVVTGYEACCRVGMSVGKEHYRVWHNTSTCGPFGSAMAAADLLDLTEDETVWALGNAGTQSSGLWQFLETGAMSKHLHTARGAESGVLAARLAAQGFTGPEEILEGAKGFYAGLCADPDPSAVTADAGRPWELTRTSIKPWPCCRHTHPAIDAAIALHGELGGAAFERVDVGAYRAALDVCDRPLPEDPYSAKFSLQHCVAAALTDGEVVQSSFDAAARQRLAAERARVSVALSAAIDAAYPKSWGASVVVTTADGRRLEATRRDAKGDPENPVTAAELAVKGRALIAGGGISDVQAAEMVEAILDLASDRPVRGLLPFSLTAAGGGSVQRMARSG